MQRKTEMSVRTALGAKRTRIVRQLPDGELPLLAGIGGMAALAVSYGGARMLLMLAFPGDQHLPISSRPSMEVLWFAMCVAMATGVLFGFGSGADRCQGSASGCLAQRDTDDDGRGFTAATRAGGAAGGVVGCAAGGRKLFSQSLGRLQHTDMKLESKNRYIVHINAQAAGYKDEQINALFTGSLKMVSCNSGRGEGGGEYLYADGRQR